MACYHLDKKMLEPIALNFGKIQINTLKRVALDSNNKYLWLATYNGLAKFTKPT
ncbi:MAG: hypothetical protein ABIX01_03795 [Chitinophagaceae bacterium]